MFYDCLLYNCACLTRVLDIENRNENVLNEISIRLNGQLDFVRKNSFVSMPNKEVTGQRNYFLDSISASSSPEDVLHGSSGLETLSLCLHSVMISRLKGPFSKKLVTLKIFLNNAEFFFFF